MNALNVLYFRWRTSLRACSFLGACLLFSGHANAGLKTGADFLKIPIGAEPAALGEAYTALAHGINSLNWNPAGLAKTPVLLNAPTLGVSFSHQDHFSENNLDHLGLVMPANKSARATWGLDLIRLAYTPQERRDENRQPSGTFGASDVAFGAALAHNFGSFQAGTQLKIIRMDLGGAHAEGMALDLGLLAQTSNPRLSLGLAARNIGPQMKFFKEKFDLPWTLSFGTAYKLSGPITLACDIHVKPREKQTTVSLGTEMMASKNISLRAGYIAKLVQAIQNNQKSETNRGNFSGISGLAAGFGLAFRQFNLDYSITPFGELGNTQRLTLSTWFGNTAERKNEFNASNHIPENPENFSDRLILILPINNPHWWE